MEKRKLDRRKFSYYMRVVDAHTEKLVGHLVDISTDGFKLDCQLGLPLNVDYMLRVDVPAEISNTRFITFTARSKWCKPDRYDPNSFNIGFQIVAIHPSNRDIFIRLFEKYGTQQKDNKFNSNPLW